MPGPVTAPTIPLETKVFTEVMDPFDILDFEVDAVPILEEGESIASYTLSIPTESALLGLQLNTPSNLYAASVAMNVIKFWASIDTTVQTYSIFTNGVILPIELSITTNSTPPRKKQRTVGIRVVHR